MNPKILICFLWPTKPCLGGNGKKFWLKQGLGWPLWLFRAVSQERSASPACVEVIPGVTLYEAAPLMAKNKQTKKKFKFRTQTELFLAVTRGRRRIQGCCETLSHPKNAPLALPSRQGVILGDSSASGTMENPFCIYIKPRGAAVQCPWRHPGRFCSFGRCFPKVFPKDLQPWCGLSRPDYSDKGRKWLLRGISALPAPRAVWEMPGMPAGTPAANAESMDVGKH